MLWFWILLGALGILLLLYLALFAFVFVRRWENDITKIRIPARSKWAQYVGPIRQGANWVNTHRYEEISLPATDGVALYGRWFSGDGRKIILLFHGYRSLAKNDFGCALEFYHAQGFHILLADQRAHGKSRGRLITFGIKERYDCKAWMDYLNDRFGGDCEIFLGGMSMGTATVLMALGLELPATVRGVSGDSGFTSPAAILSAVGRQMRLPPALLLRPLDVLCRLFGRFSIYEASTVTALEKNTVPVLFIHGAADTFVPSRMSEENYQACKGPKRLVLVEQAEHGLGFLVNREQVQGAVTEFLKNPLQAANEL